MTPQREQLTNTELQSARTHIRAAMTILQRAKENRNRKRGVVRAVAKELSVLDRAIRSAYRG